jgi:hypothetical protein
MIMTLGSASKVRSATCHWDCSAFQHRCFRGIAPLGVLLRRFLFGSVPLWRRSCLLSCTPRRMNLTLALLRQKLANIERTA